MLTALAGAPVRHQALVRLMMNSGFRISEMTALNFGDVWADGKVRPRIRLEPRRLKGGRGPWRRSVESRTVVVNAAAAAALEEYVFALFGSAGPPELAAPLFQSRKGTRLSRWQANRDIHRSIAAAGIERGCRGELGSHVLRKTFCMNIYMLGKDINLTRAVMQHRHIQTTQAYLAVRQDEVEKAVLAIGSRCDSHAQRETCDASRQAT